MKILALGDVIGSEGVDYVCSRLRAFKRENKIDFTVINGENSAKANGIDPLSAENLLAGGADVITTGNHVYRINAVYDYLDTSEFVIRPANYPRILSGRWIHHCRLRISAHAGNERTRHNVYGAPWQSF